LQEQADGAGLYERHGEDQPKKLNAASDANYFWFFSKGAEFYCAIVCPAKISSQGVPAGNDYPPLSPSFFLTVNIGKDGGSMEGSLRRGRR
jgi:hypothetical protein